MREIYVEKNKNNLKITSYIKDIFPSLKTSVIYKALREKDIKVNNKRISKDIEIFKNDKITIYISDNILFNLPKSLDVIFEDNNILVLYKPQGILSNNEDALTNFSNNRLEPTFEDIVQKIYPNAKICHRLDRNTGGLVIFSKNESSYVELLNGFKNGNITKEYVAYVTNSKFSKNSDTLNKYILKDAKNGIVKVYDKNVLNSQSISTSYKVKYKNELLDYAILNVIIYTGKTHQIRAQMAQINHNIIGDPKYGINDVNKKFNMFKQLLFAVKYTFAFDSLSPLSYLNNICIKLDEKYYIDKLPK